MLGDTQIALEISDIIYCTNITMRMTFVNINSRITALEWNSTGFNMISGPKLLNRSHSFKKENENGRGKDDEIYLQTRVNQVGKL